jgi:hypothetical protein
MKVRIRSVVVALVCAALLMGLAGPAGAWGRQASNVSTHAISTPGRSSTSDMDMVVEHLNGPNAYVQTRAYARSIHCKGCDATAATVHIVLVDSPVRNVVASNRANSINQMCSECTTTAVSYQLVVAGPGQLSVSSTGWSLLAGIEAKMESTRVTGLDAVAAVDSAVQQAVAVLENHVSVAPPATHRGRSMAPPRPDVQVLRHVHRR